jgi:hypothetical protein
MKKIILSLAFATAILTSAFAAPVEREPGFAVKNSFSKEFANIKDVKWEELNNRTGVYLATFSFNNEQLQAFFTEEGEFLGTTRQITSAQLPIMVIKEMGKQYPNAKVASVYEYSLTDGLAYYITVVTEKTSMIVKATGAGELTVYKKQKQ